jgi:plasmid maintenance system antidote protein VapI
MKPSEYLDAAKARLNITSDYELAKRFGIPDANIPGMRDESRKVSIDVAFKLAITLELDPAQVVADLEMQRAKNPTRRAFWDSFMSRAKSVTALILCTLVFQFSAIYGNQTGPVAGFFRRTNRA